MFSMRKETTVIDDDPVAWQDRRQIDLAQSYQVRDWCKAFRCTKEELHDAVKAVGPTAGQVREYLERRAGFVRGIELPGARTPEIR
jgi:hypothetical protein